MDPPAELFTRLQGIKFLRLEGVRDSVTYDDPKEDRVITLEKGSQARTEDVGSWRITHKVTGERGALCDVEILEWVGPSEVLIEVFFYAGPLAGSWYKATAKKQDGRWVIDPGSVTDFCIS